MSINCRENYIEQFPWHDGSRCGPIEGVEDECACGCTAYDELCEESSYGLDSSGASPETASEPPSA